MKNNKSKIIASVIAASFALTVAPAGSVFAASKKVKSTLNAESNNGLNIRYVGEDNGMVFVKITLNQPKEQKSYLEIFDFSGEKLYEEAVVSKDFSRIIKVSPDELKTLHVTYRTGETENKKTFTINATVTAKYEIAEVAE